MTIDERLDAITQTLELMALRQADYEERQADYEERHEREMEDIRKEGAATRAELRRAIRLSVQDARNERRRRHELDDKITQLAAAQLITEEKLQRFIDSLGRGGNGNK